MIGLRLILSFLLVGILVSFADGLKCYACNDCVRDSMRVVDCDELYNTGPDAEQKMVCEKDGGGGASGPSRGCKLVKGEQEGNLCDSAKPKGWGVVNCYCEQDKCNGGPPTSKLQGGLGLQMIILFTTTLSLSILK